MDRVVTVAENEASPKRRGRPSLPAGEKKRHTMTFRVRPFMKEQLEAAAKQNQRSVSEEIESILSKYLYEDPVKYGYIDHNEHSVLVSELNQAISHVNDWYKYQGTITKAQLELADLLIHSDQPEVVHHASIIVGYLAQADLSAISKEIFSKVSELVAKAERKIPEDKLLAFMKRKYPS